MLISNSGGNRCLASLGSAILFATWGLSAVPLAAQSRIDQELAQMRTEMKLMRQDLTEVKDSLGQIAAAFQRSRMRGEDVSEVKYRPNSSSADDFALGDPRAPVLIMEFSDFECPFCARFARATFPEIKKQLIDTGKVRYIFRDFPLQMHRHAPQAAGVAACAGAQGYFREAHDALFGDPQSVSAGDFSPVLDAIPQLDRAKFDACLKSPELGVSRDKNGEAPSPEALADFKDGAKLGISATPSFFIARNRPGAEELRGVLLRGSQPFENFNERVSDYLN